MTGTSFTGLLAGLARAPDGTMTGEIPADWMQGRTTYGGLTSALCLEAARSLVPDIPLRAVQVAFIGPSGGEVSIAPSILRQGKNTAFVNVDLTGPQGLAARTLFTFGQRRDSQIHFHDLPMPAGLPGPEDAPSLFGQNRDRPHFTQHFNMRLAEGQRPVSQAPEPLLGLWLRHKDEAAGTSPTALLALADAPPPAVMPMFTEPAPISSMTWMAEFLTDEITTKDGWFYARHLAQSAGHGYSSQSMRLWSRSGEPVLIGRQTIAVFA